jgi:hypothetical protein
MDNSGPAKGVVDMGELLAVKYVVSNYILSPMAYLGGAFSVEPLLAQSTWFRSHNQ